MCGITGFIGHGSESDVKAMTNTLLHRGPDDRGTFFSTGIGLGHTRLSILDVSPMGHQPMWTKDHQVAIVFNGEIYNFSSLREKLINRGHTFASKSDTEVILALYKEFGTKCFEHLNGMFAIALYDKREKKLILARDRMGEKPLYWGIFNGTLLFGSEIKSLLCHPLCKKELDSTSVNRYFLYDYVPTSRSIFKNIYKLDPATALTFQNGIVKKDIFWKPQSTEINASSTGEILRKLDQKIEESVISQLVSDVPLGIFLSGGIDSSTIAYYVQKNASRKIQTFSIGFDEKSFDESPHALHVARTLGTDHHESIFRAEDALNLIPRLADILDEPLADPSIIPTYFLSKFTKGFVTVALGGDGGDELFAGYPTFEADAFAKVYEKIPLIARRLLGKAIYQIPASEKNFGFGFQLRKFVEGIEKTNDPYRHQRWLGTFNKPNRERLFTKDFLMNVSDVNEFEDVDRHRAEVNSLDEKQAMLYLYMRTYLMDQVLVKVDRASMANGLEVRAPFLNYELVEFVQSLPYNLKYRFPTTKYLLKLLMKDKLPRQIVKRKKKGFGIPVARWLRNELKDVMEEMLEEKFIRKQNLFNYEYVQSLKNDHFQYHKDNRKELWSLLMFQLWFKKWS